MGWLCIHKAYFKILPSTYVCLRAIKTRKEKQRLFNDTMHKPTIAISSVCIIVRAISSVYTRARVRGYLIFLASLSSMRKPWLKTSLAPICFSALVSTVKVKNIKNPADKWKYLSLSKQSWGTMPFIPIKLWPMKSNM